MSLIRRREVADGMREHLELTNHGLKSVDVEITLLFDADFADLFEVKDDLTKTGQLYRQREHNGVTLGYVRGDFRRETYIHARDALLHRAVADVPGVARASRDRGRRPCT